jgi:hypothetical protein
MDGETLRAFQDMYFTARANLSRYILAYVPISGPVSLAVYTISMILRYSKMVTDARISLQLKRLNGIIEQEQI